MNAGVRVRVVGVAVVLCMGAALALAIARMRQFVPYVPVLAEGRDWTYVEHPEMLSPQLCRAFAGVAAGYGYDVRENDDGSLMIRRSLRNSRELLWNLTTKAQAASRLDRTMSNSGKNTEDQP